MRQIIDHKLNGLNDALEISVIDEPGQGGACHDYQIQIVKPDGFQATDAPGGGLTFIYFQNGPVQEFGPNGISGEALLAIVIDRLRSFQAGPYACGDNAEALHHAEQCLTWLQKRTRERLARGVEGTSQK